MKLLLPRLYCYKTWRSKERRESFLKKVLKMISLESKSATTTPLVVGRSGMNQMFGFPKAFVFSSFSFFLLQHRCKNKKKKKKKERGELSSNGTHNLSCFFLFSVFLFRAVTSQEKKNK